jgi:hypothetical protein
MTVPDRMSGRLVQTYSFVAPADPGFAQHARHTGEGEVPNLRDDAPSGGGWQPAIWGESGVNVLPGGAGTAAYPTSPANDASHKGSDDGHKGSTGRGAAGASVVRLDNPDSLTGGDSPGQLLGAGGAANGGLRADGSAPWMNPGASRRRADGGVVTRAPGFLLGHRHVPVTGDHHQGLHMNKPTIRGVRQKIITHAADPNNRAAGVVIPKSHAQLQGVAYDSAESAPTRDSGAIGGEWAL